MPENRAEYLKRIKKEWNKAAERDEENKLRSRDVIKAEMCFQLSRISDNIMRLK